MPTLPFQDVEKDASASTGWELGAGWLLGRGLCGVSVAKESNAVWGLSFNL